MILWIAMFKNYRFQSKTTKIKSRGQWKPENTRFVRIKERVLKRTKKKKKRKKKGQKKFYVSKTAFSEAGRPRKNVKKRETVFRLFSWKNQRKPLTGRRIHILSSREGCNIPPPPRDINSRLIIAFIANGVLEDATSQKVPFNRFITRVKLRDYFIRILPVPRKNDRSGNWYRISNTVERGRGGGGGGSKGKTGRSAVIISRHSRRCDNDGAEERNGTVVAYIYQVVICKARVFSAMSNRTSVSCNADDAITGSCATSRRFIHKPRSSVEIMARESVTHEEHRTWTRSAHNGFHTGELWWKFGRGNAEFLNYREIEPRGRLHLHLAGY